MLHNKRAAIPETITWIIATVIIIVILIFSIFIVSWFKDDKSFKSDIHRDLLLAKSISGFLLTKDDSGGKVFEQIAEEGDLNDFNGLLGVVVFEDYEKMFLQLKTKPVSLWSGPTKYFVKPNSVSPKMEEFNLEENKYIVFETGI